jgi:hypothetical protein
MTARRLTRQHFACYRLLWACSTPGAGGRPICGYGQAKLAARLGVSTRTLQRLLADLREPGPDPRHPDAAPAGLRLGWLQVLPREAPGGRGGTLYGGDRYVLQVDPEQLARLEADTRTGAARPVDNPPEQAKQPPANAEPVPAGQIEATSHRRRSDRRDTPESPIAAAQIEATGEGVSLRRYVRSTSGTGGAFTHPESGPADLEPVGASPPPLSAGELERPEQPQTNNGLRRWIPPEEYVARKAGEIAATQGVANAERYLDAVRRRQERLERMRAAGRHAQAVQAAESPDGSAPALGGYGRWLPGAPAGRPALPAPQQAPTSAEEAHRAAQLAALEATFTEEERAALTASDPEPCEDCPEEATG